jgi:Reverse transcriptase (RNA-dependent DNA polymerase)
MCQAGAPRSEVWDVVNRIIKPKEEEKLVLTGSDQLEKSDPAIVAELFNDFFLSKVEELHLSINKANTEDPIPRLRQSITGERNARFYLRTVSEQTVKKAIGKLKNKKSSGIDGLSTDLLKTAREVLAVPLTLIINTSIRTGVFPAPWKKAKVKPLLKKGNKMKKENYRPVSLLPVASKVLEAVVNKQVVEHLEGQGILPPHQHGFRRGRSTTTALISMHSAWIKAYEEGKNTGIILWDLSAAFDLIDHSILIKKMEVYGFDPVSVAWFGSFLCGRTQSVEVQNKLSSPRAVKRGCPQGAILSPTCFILYCADIAEWVKEVTVSSYADDTTTSFSHENIEVVKAVLEHQAKNVLEYMAANRLVANTKKTSFLLARRKRGKEDPQSLMVGKEVVLEEQKARLLGMTIQNSLDWTEHVRGVGGLINKLNSSLFLLSRLSRHISPDLMRPVLEGIFTSHIRYGLALYGRVRLTGDEPQDGLMGEIQVIVNKAARMMLKVQLKDRLPVTELLQKANMLSVNQMVAEAKLMETWKGLSEATNPLRELFTHGHNQHSMQGRSTSRGDLVVGGGSMKANRGFPTSAARIWNKTQETLRKATTKASARKNIRDFISLLPVQ